jgi:flagellar biosynthesis/type III secretory pathway protein FliH
MAAGGPKRWHWPSLGESDDRCAGSPTAESAGQVEQSPDGAEEAERLVRESRQQAARLVEQAHDQAERIRCEAHAEALEEARTALRGVVAEMVEEQKAAFASARRDLLQRMEAASQERLEALERELTGLVAMMAEKVIHRKVEAEDGVVLDVVRATIERAAGADRFTVRVPAPEEKLVREATRELLAVADGAEQFEIVPDESIGTGGCVVETERGRFDARIETQLELLNEQVEQVTGEGGDAPS